MVTVRGDSNSNVIYQDDYGYELDIYAYGGNDRIYLNVDGANGGWNWVSAGSGDDRVYNVFEGGNDIDLGTGNDFYSSTGFSTGRDYYDVVFGYDGNDVFEVSTFHSDYYGESGTDTFYSVGYNNLFDGGPGIDAISYELQDHDADLAGAGVIVDLRYEYAQTKGTDYEEILVSIENVVGSGAADNLYGSGGGNRIWGSAGNDYVYGDSGDDFLYGEAGNDSVLGASGNDFLSGGDGNDRVGGGSGNDIVYGGSGADRFLFNTALNSSANVDEIRYFNVAADLIEVDNAIFTRFATTGGISASTFVSNTSGVAQDANDYLIYESDTGELFYDSNGSAAGGSTLFAQLDPNLSLTSQDFQVI
jgi:serralysin